MTGRTYDGVAKTLHWVIVALVVAQFFTKLATPKSFAGVTQNGSMPGTSLSGRRSCC